MLLFAIFLWVPMADHTVRGDPGFQIRWVIPDGCKGSFLIIDPTNKAILEVTRFYSGTDAGIRISRGCFDKYGIDTCIITGHVTIPGTYDIVPTVQSGNFTCNQSFVVQPKAIHTKTSVLAVTVGSASLVTLTLLFAVFCAKRIFKARIRQAAGRTVLQSAQSNNDVGCTEIDEHGLNDGHDPYREGTMPTDIVDDPYTDNYDYPSPCDYPYYRMTSGLYLTPCSDSDNEGDYSFEHPQKNTKHLDNVRIYADADDNRSAITDEGMRDSDWYITPVIDLLPSERQDYKTFPPSKSYENREKVECMRLDNPVLDDDVESRTTNQCPTNDHDYLDNDGYLIPSNWEIQVYVNHKVSA